MYGLVLILSFNFDFEYLYIFSPSFISDKYIISSWLILSFPRICILFILNIGDVIKNITSPKNIPKSTVHFRIRKNIFFFFLIFLELFLGAVLFPALLFCVLFIPNYFFFI